MEFYEAIELAKNNENLIGKPYKGAIIDEIILVPTDFEEETKFERLYRRYLDGKIAIAPFINSDVLVKCVMNKQSFINNIAFLFVELKDVIDSIQQNVNDDEIRK